MANTKKATRTSTKTKTARRPSRSSKKNNNNLLARLKNNKQVMAILFILAFALVGYAIYNSAKAEVRPLGTEVTGVGSLVPSKSDEFNGTSLDLSKWRPNWLAGSDTAVTPPINSDEESCYDPKQVTVSGGTVKLKAEVNNGVPGCVVRNGSTAKYKSGMIQSDADNDDYKYGYYEARVYFPGSNGRVSNFPAFWTNGQPNWPANGEIDIVEGLGGIVRAHYHGPSGSAGSPSRNPSWMPDPTGWHVYGMKRERGRVTFYYNGRQIWTHSSGVVDSPHFVIFNNGISREHGGPQVVPSTMEVDYFRFWELGSGTGTPAPNDPPQPPSEPPAEPPQPPQPPSELPAEPPADNGGPRVTFEKLQRNYSVGSNVTLKVSASDPDGVSRASFYQNDLNGWMGTDTRAPYEYTMTNLKAGTYKVFVRVSDSKNNTTTTETQTFTVGSGGGSGGGGTPTGNDTQAPSTPTNLSRSLPLTWNGYVIRLTWAPSTDNVGVRDYVISVSTPNGAQSIVTSSTRYDIKNPQRNVPYTFSVSARDAAGNTSSRSSSVRAVVDCTFIFCGLSEPATPPPVK